MFWRKERTQPAADMAGEQFGSVAPAGVAAGGMGDKTDSHPAGKAACGEEAIEACLETPHADHQDSKGGVHPQAARPREAGRGGRFRQQ